MFCQAALRVSREGHWPLSCHGGTVTWRFTGPCLYRGTVTWRFTGPCLYRGTVTWRSLAPLLSRHCHVTFTGPSFISALSVAVTG